MLKYFISVVTIATIVVMCNYNCNTKESVDMLTANG